MRVKINADRRVTIPAEVMESLGVKPGEYVEVEPLPGGVALRPETKPEPKRYDLSMYGYLRDKIDPNTPPLLDFTPYREGEIDITPYRD